MRPEQRLDRAERILVMMANAGRRARQEWREQSREQNEKINILINMHIQNEEQWRAESHALDEKINILIHTQMETSEQIKQTSEQIKQTSEQIKQTSEQISGLAAGQTRSEKEMAELREAQKLTDKTLRAFIDSLRKGGNGNSS